MFELIGLIATGAATAAGYIQSKSFVKHKLRYVDAARGPKAPWIAGTGAAILAAPVVGLLPIIGAGTAIVFGIGVGAGVAAGARDLRRRLTS